MPVFAYASIAQGSEYACIWLNNAPWQDAEYLPVLNMSGLRIWQGCEYARVTQGAEYAWFVELGHFNKHFIKNTCKRGLTEKLLEFFY